MPPDARTEGEEGSLYVACSTLCFTKEPIETALRHIAELEFEKFDLQIVENGTHLKPSEVAESLDAAAVRLRQGPSLTPSAIGLEFGDLDPLSPVYRKRFDAVCRLCKPITVAVITVQAAPIDSSFDDEVKRLKTLSWSAMQQGLVLAVETNSATLTANPDQALALCQAVPGLGITLDPSHYLQGPFTGADYDSLFPFVQNVYLRDTSRRPGEFQVRIGQGEIEYGRIVAMLQRYGYNRALTVAIRDDIDSPFDTEVEVRKLKRLLESQL